MRTLCDACESAFAIVFCAADEAALCLACDKKVHMCNKLASRHVRVGLANPSEVPRCDICENAPAFFYCETDGSSLCLQCDMTVHVGGKRTHGRYLLLRQKIEFPGDQPQPEDPAPQPMYPGETRRGQNRPQKATAGENRQNRQPSPVLMSVTNSDGHDKVDKNMIDLNMKPHRIHEHASNNQKAKRCFRKQTSDPSQNASNAETLPFASSGSDMNSFGEDLKCYGAYTLNFRGNFPRIQSKRRAVIVGKLDTFVLSYYINFK